MHDDKRQQRRLKRDIKRTGNKRRRRYLKDLAVDPDQFEFGRHESAPMNQRPQPRTPENNE